MLVLYLIIDSLFAIGLLGIGVLALLKSTKAELNNLFFFFALFMAFWVITNYFSNAPNISPELTRIFNHLVLFFPGLGIIYLLKFCLAISPKNFITKHQTKLTYFGYFGSVLALTPLVVAGISRQDEVVAIKFGPLAIIYFLSLLLNILACFICLIYGIRHSDGQDKQRSKTILWSIGIFLMVNVLTNVLLPFLAGAFALTNIGPLTSTILVGGLAYTIIRHRLFDIRLAIVRSLGFVITIGLIGGFYSALILGIGSIFAGNRASFIKEPSELLIIIPATIFIGLTFHTIQSYIAQITRRFFYQDLFDLKTTLDRFSDTLVTSNDIDQIMKNSLTVISEAIKPTHAYFVVFGDDGRVYRKISLSTEAPESISELIGDIKNMPLNPVVRENLSEKEVPRSFLENDISLALRLGQRANPTGMLLFGPKQNGRIYAQIDTDLLRIGAKNLTIAIDNAKKYSQISHFAETMRGEVQKATAKLRHANEELKSLDTLKDDFISMASHQLRTPATSVHEALQMLNHATMPLTKEERAKLIDLAEASSEHLATVVSDMLSISRIQAGHFTINKESIDLVKLVERVIKQTSVLAEQKNIKLAFDKPSKLEAVNVDQAKINEAVSNYIENAIKYSAAKTTIHIKLAKQGNRIIFEVKDSGIGVPEKNRKQLFGKFYRAENARKEQPDGNGIGLFVVKSIALGHNGDTYYKPQETGSLFGFWLPVN